MLLIRKTIPEEERFMHDHPRARCWLEVDTAAIIHNLEVTRRLISPQTELIAVLKADAYGLGAVPVARLLWAHGVRRYSVACLSEAFSLHEALPDAWILCMGETLGGAVMDAVYAGIRLTVGSYDSAKRVSEAAQELGCSARIHYKVDTGLYRIGFESGRAVNEIRRCSALPNLDAEGIYTHLALHDKETDIRQHEALERILCELRSEGICPPLVHMLDSIGIVRYPQWQYQAVRVGAMLYGNAPRGMTGELPKPTVRFMARVARVFSVPSGSLIGYDDEHPLDHDARIAVISAGYADGYPRVFSRCGEIMIHGMRAKIVGLICMDQMMADITDIPGVSQNDEVTLLGDGISLTEYASVGKLNRNECTAVIGKRVPRIYS